MICIYDFVYSCIVFVIIMFDQSSLMDIYTESKLLSYCIICSYIAIMFCIYDFVYSCVVLLLSCLINLH